LQEASATARTAIFKPVMLDWLILAEKPLMNRWRGESI